MLENVRERMRSWLVGVFTTTIRYSTEPTDRTAIIDWLIQSRTVVAGGDPPLTKLRQLNGLISSRAVVRATVSNISRVVSDYRHSNLPLSVKIAVPATLAAIPFIGGQAAGIAAFGGALGVPVLLLVFLGVSGITAVIETLITTPGARVGIALVTAFIIKDERARRASAALKKALSEDVAEPRRAECPGDEILLRQCLQTMDSFVFEQHVMSFFSAAGLVATVTQKSNDFGVDGGAVHSDGLIIVQCKRYAGGNRVGRPAVQQFKGVVEEQGAARGYTVTTSDFTDEARASAAMSQKIRLIDIEGLLRWHNTSPESF